MPLFQRSTIILPPCGSRKCSWGGGGGWQILRVSSFIHSFNFNLLGIYYVPSTEKCTMSQQDMKKHILCLPGSLSDVKWILIIHCNPTRKGKITNGEKYP